MALFPIWRETKSYLGAKFPEGSEQRQMVQGREHREGLQGAKGEVGQVMQELWGKKSHKLMEVKIQKHVEHMTDAHFLQQCKQEGRKSGRRWDWSAAFAWQTKETVDLDPCAQESTKHSSLHAQRLGRGMSCSEK